MQGYFESIDRATTRCRSAKTPADVVKFLGWDTEASAGDAFYGGDGDELLGALYDAGWSSHRYEAPYYWVVKAPNGEFLSYTEGDVSVGDNPTCGR